ncbi:MAG: hypothetical protein JSV03_03245, partial [Planctomycetota bacterium]
VIEWLARPSRFMPATIMPMHFGENLSGAFVDYLPVDRDKVAARLQDKTLLENGAGQIEAVVSFLFDASAKRLNKVQPAGEAEGTDVGG